LKLSRRGFAAATWAAAFGLSELAAAAPPGETPPRDSSSDASSDTTSDERSDEDTALLQKLDLLVDLALLEEWDPSEDLPIPLPDATDPPAGSPLDEGTRP